MATYGLTPDLFIRAAGFALAEGRDALDLAHPRLAFAGRASSKEWDAYWDLQLPEDRERVQALCAAYSRAHPDEPVVRYAAAAALSIRLCTKLGRLVRLVEKEPSPGRLDALDSTLGIVEVNLRELVDGLGVPSEALPRVAPRRKGVTGLSDAQSRDALTYLTVMLRANRVPFPAEACLWKGLLAHLRRGLSLGDGSLPLDAAIRKILDVQGRDVSAGALTRAGPEERAKALQRAETLLDELLPRGSWPPPRDVLPLVLRYLPLVDFLAARRVSSEWLRASTEPLKSHLEEFLAESAACNSSHIALIRLCRRVWGLWGRGLWCLLAGVETPEERRKVYRLVTDVPRPELLTQAGRQACESVLALLAPVVAWATARLAAMSSAPGQ
jgi:hypothetical protein